VGDLPPSLCGDHWADCELSYRIGDPHRRLTGRATRQEAQVGRRGARVLYDGDRAGGPVEYGARDLADPAFSTPDRCRDWRQHAVGLRSMQRRRCRERTGKQQDVDVEPMSPTSATNRSTTRE
jgi:hypothetical protein